MSLRINAIARKLIKGFRLNDVVTSSSFQCASNVRSVASSADLSCTTISKYMVPLSSVNFKDNSISLLNASTQRPQILDKPISLNIFRIDLPMIKSNIRYEDITPSKEIEDPKSSTQIEKHAVRMIIIRRRKMRIHKLKRLRKKLKFIRAKLEHKRKSEKEKVFQAELMTKINAAQKFDPAAYVEEKLRKANEVIVPKTWRGKRLPEFIIKDLIERRDEKRIAKEARMERRKNMNVNASDY